MKKTVLALLLLCSIIFAFSGGDGTLANPYQISTQADLEAVNDDLSAHYKLVTTIDLCNKYYYSAIIAPDTDDDSTSFEGTKFTGFFDGNNCYIKNMRINCKNYGGLFGATGETSRISDLKISDSEVFANRFVGTLVGANYGDIVNYFHYKTNVIGSNSSVGGQVGENYGIIISCYSLTATVYPGNTCSGGLVGKNYGIIADCTYESSIDIGDGTLAFYTIGGLVGENYGTIANCYANSSCITGGDSDIGGLVGINEGKIIDSYTNWWMELGDSSTVGGLVGINRGSISNCYSWSCVDAKYGAGGLVALNSGSIERSYATGSVGVKGSNAGGLVGTNSATGTLYNCYASGSAYTGAGRAGGLIGDNWGKLTNCYSTGRALTTEEQLGCSAGGLVGAAESSDDAVNCFWDTQTSDLSSSAGGAGKTTAEMKTQSTFSGWDFADIWYMSGYPKLSEINTVVFDEGQFGTIASDNIVQAMYDGGSAIAPIVIAIHGWVFTGWDKSIDNVTEDLVVTAQYELDTFTVDFNAGGHGAITSGEAAQEIVFGSAATAPIIGPDYGWVFTGWDESYNNISDDLIVTAQYERDIFTVTFITGNCGTITDDQSTQQVAYESAAVGPTVTVDPDWVFLGWDTDFSYVTSDLTITARCYKAMAGSGTEQDPYQIARQDQLQAVNYDLSASYILISDLDLSGTVYTKAVIAPDTDASSIFAQGPKFTGSFDGNSFEIQNLTIAGGTNEYLGLFGSVESSGNISNLEIINCNISGYDYVGALVGRNQWADISNCYSSGNVAGIESCGGLIGTNWDGNIANCYTSCNVTGNNRAGGLVGYNQGGNISDCYATGNIKGEGDAGGLVGRNCGSIVNCYAAGNVIDAYSSGGLVGSNLASISNCYAQGDITDAVYAGGLVGSNTTDAIIENCYSTGNSVSSSYAGGLVAWNKGSISYCYSLGNITGAFSSSGLVQYNSGLVTDCFWDTEASQLASSNGGVGITTFQMQTESTFTNAGWDFIGETQNGTENFWIIASGEYPKLTALVIYTVTFDAGIHGEITAGSLVQSVRADSAAIAPIVTPDDGWIFTGWDADFSNVTNDMTVTAQYTQVFTVAFGAGVHGTITGGEIVQEILSGASAIAPIVSADYGWDFVGWDADFSSVTGDMTITAQYEARMSDGTKENPYLIRTKLELEAVNDDLAAYYVLINDIDLASETYAAAVIAPDTDNTDWVFTGSMFTGSFNGNGFAIYNLTINATNPYIGLFGNVGDGASISNLGIIDCNVTGTYDVGGLIGRNEGDIEDCYAEGTVSGENSSGGLIGGNWGDIRYCHATGTVNVDCSGGGGLIGDNSGHITNCYATATVLGDQAMGSMSVGGLVGQVNSGNITNCYATGDVTSATTTGGLIGQSFGNIANCYATGNVTMTGGFGSAGGLVGENFENIVGCYSTGTVTGAGYVGGFAGMSSESMGWSPMGGSEIDALSSESDVSSGIVSCFWDVDASGLEVGYNVQDSSVTVDVTGKTTADMKTISTFTAAGWDYANEDSNGQMGTWFQADAQYPKLYWQAMKGDFNYDGKVNSSDLIIIAEQWLGASSEALRLEADSNMDQTVDMADFVILATNWLSN